MQALGKGETPWRLCQVLFPVCMCVRTLYSCDILSLTIFLVKKNLTLYLWCISYRCEILELGSDPSTQPLDFTEEDADWGGRGGGQDKTKLNKNIIGRMLIIENKMQSVKEWVMEEQNEKIKIVKILLRKDIKGRLIMVW